MSGTVVTITTCPSCGKPIEATSNVETIHLTEKENKRINRGFSYLPDYMIDDNGDALPGEWF